MSLWHAQDKKKQRHTCATTCATLLLIAERGCPANHTGHHWSPTSLTPMSPWPFFLNLEVGTPVSTALHTRGHHFSGKKRFPPTPPSPGSSHGLPGGKHPSDIVPLNKEGDRAARGDTFFRTSSALNSVTFHVFPLHPPQLSNKPGQRFPRETEPGVPRQKAVPSAGDAIFWQAPGLPHQRSCLLCGCVY